MHPEMGAFFNARLTARRSRSHSRSEFAGLPILWRWAASLLPLSKRPTRYRLALEDRNTFMTWFHSLPSQLDRFCSMSDKVSAIFVGWSSLS